MQIIHSRSSNWFHSLATLPLKWIFNKKVYSGWQISHLSLLVAWAKPFGEQSKSWQEMANEAGLSCQATHWLALINKWSLMTILINFASAATHKSLLVGYVFKVFEQFTLSLPFGLGLCIDSHITRRKTRIMQLLSTVFLFLIPGILSFTVQVWWWSWKLF